LHRVIHCHDDDDDDADIAFSLFRATGVKLLFADYSLTVENI
jgi:hypothetical protein